LFVTALEARQPTTCRVNENPKSTSGSRPSEGCTMTAYMIDSNRQAIGSRPASFHHRRREQSRSGVVREVLQRLAHVTLDDPIDDLWRPGDGGGA
jgi:hypothetical protein